MPSRPEKIRQDLIARHLRSYRCTAFILQGGGALGAYQAGVHGALLEAGIQPDWLAGISIGAINAAIIAGNPVERQAERLREFWETVTTDVEPPWCALASDRSAINALGSLHALYVGQPGFYEPRLPPPWRCSRAFSAAVATTMRARLRPPSSVWSTLTASIRKPCG